jgi:uncharacterized membrane protein YeaQ/YmgE (transglycosylase-associated protein family)
MLIGIAGSIVASYVGPLIGWYPRGGVMSFVASVAGAMILLLLYRLVARD